MSAYQQWKSSKRAYKLHLSALLVVGTLLLTIASSFGHSWYDASCCSNRDCHPVNAEDVIELENGSWKYLPLNIVFTKDKVKPSRDGKFHVCYGPESHYPFCIYILMGM